MDPESGLPPCVALRSDTGEEARLYLTYDNIAVISGSYRFLEHIAASILRTLNEHNIAVKEHYLYSAKDLGRGLPSCTHLGVEYALTSSGHLRVRLSERCITKWRAASTPLLAAEKCTKRKCATIVGMILHARRIRLTPLYDSELAIRALRELHPIVSWNELFEPEYMDTLRAELRFVLQNDWQLLSRPYADGKNREVIAVASDASDYGCGYIILPPDKPMSIYSNDALFEKEVHIYIKEFIAAKMAVEATCARGYKSIRLLVDNAAVAAAIRRRYSTNHVANRILKEMFETIESQEGTLEVLSIPGCWNPADEPSRGAQTAPAKLALLELALHSNIMPLMSRELAQRSRIIHHDPIDEPGLIGIDDYVEALEDLQLEKLLPKGAETNSTVC